MKIGIDARELEYPTTGIGRYTENLLYALKDSVYEIILFANKKESIKEYLFEVKQIKPVSKNILADQIYFSKCINESGLTLFVSPYYKVPLNINCKTIITFHDLMQLHKGFEKSIWERVKFNLIFKLCTKKADAIISVSKSTKEDLKKFFKIPSDKIHVVYNAIGKVFNNIEKKSELIENPYILYVGNLKPHKNVKTLIKAFSEASSKIPHKLFISAKKEDSYEELLRLSRDLSISERVHFLGHVDEKNIVSLYKNASLLVQPSFYEGFGFPLIEAMAYEVPVIASNIPSLLEVADEAALFFNPNDHSELYDKIIKLLNNKELQDNLIKKGKERIKYFSIEKFKIEILNVIDKVIKQ